MAQSQEPFRLIDVAHFYRSTVSEAIRRLSSDAFDFGNNPELREYELICQLSEMAGCFAWRFTSAH
ncbi:hypothetical protein XH83_38765 (plasmid) [Bradyrhizobium sp. CCBAU 53351]|nr:hypothetical protein XH83_38765 [Bradyrhizobium sp. CCBAU 53351]